MGSTAVIVGTTPTVIASPSPYRNSVNILNNGATIVYIDYSAGLSAGSGYPLASGVAMIFTLQGDGPAIQGYIYGVSTAPCEVRVLEG